MDTSSNQLTNYSALPLLHEFIMNQLSDHTKIAYYKDLEKFYTFLGHGKLDMVRTNQIIDYKNKLVNEGLSTETINRRLGTVNIYYEFLIKNTSLQRNPCEGVKLFPRGDFTPTQGLSNEEVVKILSKIDEKGGYFDAKQAKKGGIFDEKGPKIMHKALLFTLFFTGIRRGELVKLKCSDLDINSNPPTLTIHGKGFKKRTVPIHSQLCEVLKTYLKSYRGVYTDDSPLFSTNQTEFKNPIHVNTVYKILEKYAKQAGITKKISPHSCRVTCISNALENGANVIQVQHLGGWSSIDMVLRYDRRRQLLKNSAAFKVDYLK